MVPRNILMGVTPRTEKALFAPLMGAMGAFCFRSSGPSPSFTHTKACRAGILTPGNHLLLQFVTWDAQ